MSTAHDQSAVVPPIADDHLATLAASALAAEYAEELGIRTTEGGDDLPEDLRCYPDAGRGIVFPLLTLVGETVHQFRRDDLPETEPAEDEDAPPRYLLPKGHPPFISVTEKHLARRGQVKHIVIIEGTKQGLAGAYYAGDDVMVVAIQGCYGWSRDRMAIPDLHDLGIIQGETIVTICLDADRTTNPDVWLAGKRLAHALKLQGAAKVLFADNGGSGKHGLDDILAAQPEDKRTQYVANMLATATDKVGRKPAKKLARAQNSGPGEVYCDMASGTTWATGREVAGITLPPAQVADFAGRIVESVTTVHDTPGRQGGVRLSVEIAYRTSTGVKRVRVEVDDDQLGDIGALLAKVPGGVGVSIRRPAKRSQDAQLMENAIRSCESHRTEHVEVRSRLGWLGFNDGLYFLYQGGALGPDGAVDDCRGELEGYRRNISYAYAARKALDEEGNWTDDLRTAVREMLIGIPKLWHKPGPWYASIGALVIGEAMDIPRAALAFIGKRSSGKTLTAQTLTAAIDPEFAYRRTVMYEAKGTTNAIDGAMDDSDNSPVLADDAVPPANARKLDDQYDMLSGAVRRPHGGMGKPRMMRHRTRGVVEAPRSNSHPVLIITAEKTPDYRRIESGVDRFYCVFFDVEETYKGMKQADEMAQIGQSGRPQIANAGLIIWMARQQTALIDANPELTPQQARRQWQDAIDTQRAEIAREFTEAAAERGVKTTPRGADVAAGLYIGAVKFADFALEIGAIDQDEYEQVTAQIADDMLELMLIHIERAAGGNQSDAEQAVEALRRAVAAGSLIVGGMAFLPPGKTRLGRKFEPKGGPSYLAIIPPEDGKTLAGYTGSQLRDALSSVLVAITKDGKTRTAHQISFGDTKPYCLLIPWELWAPATAAAAATDQQAAA